jgi:aspartokinase-like uncharacterized kinase
MLELIGPVHKSMVLESLIIHRRCEVILIGDNVPLLLVQSIGSKVGYHISSEETHDVLMDLDRLLPNLLQQSKAEFIILYTNTPNEELVRAITSSYCSESKIIFMHK